MSVIDNLNKGELADLIRRVRILENRTTLNNAAIGRSGMEVYDGGSINISNGTFYLNGYGSVAGTLAVSGTLPVTGGLIVSGTERITGSWFLDGVGEVAGTMTIKGGLIVEGTQRVSGTLEITGDLNVTGPTKLNGKTDIGGNTTVTGDLGVKGPLDVTGTMDIKGKSTLQNDLTVQGGGRIKVGANMTLNPATGGGTVEFTNGASIASSGTDLKMNASGAALSLGTQAVMTGGTSTMVMAGSSTSLNTPLVIIGSRMQAQNIRQAPAGVEGNLYRDPSTGELMYIP